MAVILILILAGDNSTSINLTNYTLNESDTYTNWHLILTSAGEERLMDDININSLSKFS